MLVYSQSSGVISVSIDNEGTEPGVVATGWAGNHAGKNNPDMQDKPCVGPLPQGFYTICEWEENHGHLGPLVAFLKPDPGNEMFGRGDFFIHGPSGKNWGQESKGCIVVEHDEREAVKDTGETRLHVVA